MDFQLLKLTLYKWIFWKNEKKMKKIQYCIIYFWLWYINQLIYLYSKKKIDLFQNWGKKFNQLFSKKTSSFNFDTNVIVPMVST